MALMTTRAMPVARVPSTFARVSEAERDTRLAPDPGDRPFGPVRVHWPGDRTHRARRRCARPQPRLGAPVGGRSAAAGDRAAGLVDRGLPDRDPADGDGRFGVRHGRRGSPRRRPDRARRVRAAGRRGRGRRGRPGGAGRDVYDHGPADAAPGPVGPGRPRADAVGSLPQRPRRGRRPSPGRRRAPGGPPQVPRGSFPRSCWNLPPRPHRHCEQAEGG
jgi:hypothetical protein